MNIYTTIFFDDSYQDNKARLKEIISNYNLMWNNSEIKTLSYGETIGIYRLFKCEDALNNFLKGIPGMSGISGMPVMTGISGITGIWKNDEHALKIIIFNRDDLPVLMIYKGNEDTFHKEFVGYCIKIGCTIGKLVEDENGIREVFKRKLDREIVEKIKSKEESKDVMLKIFNMKLHVMEKLEVRFSDSFVLQWKRCIQDYGYYDNENLIKEIKEKNNFGDSELNG